MKILWTSSNGKACLFCTILETPLDDQKLNGIKINLISVVHKLLDSIAESAAKNDVDIDQQIIMVKLFQCLEILYDNIDLTQNVNNGIEVNWIEIDLSE